MATTNPAPLSLIAPTNYFERHAPGKPRLKARLSNGEVAQVGAAEWRHRALEAIAARAKAKVAAQLRAAGR